MAREMLRRERCVEELKGGEREKEGLRGRDLSLEGDN